MGIELDIGVQAAGDELAQVGDVARLLLDRHTHCA